jgi:hypothetical protein
VVGALKDFRFGDPSNALKRMNVTMWRIENNLTVELAWHTNLFADEQGNTESRESLLFIVFL